MNRRRFVAALAALLVAPKLAALMPKQTNGHNLVMNIKVPNGQATSSAATQYQMAKQMAIVGERGPELVNHTAQSLDRLSQSLSKFERSIHRSVQIE